MPMAHHHHIIIHSSSHGPSCASQFSFVDDNNDEVDQGVGYQSSFSFVVFAGGGESPINLLAVDFLLISLLLGKQSQASEQRVLFFRHLFCAKCCCRGGVSCR